MRSTSRRDSENRDLPPIEVHVGGCYAAGKRRCSLPRDEARRLLTSGVRACTHCKPCAQLRILN
ncbi:MULTISPECIES: DUF6233 domain-containing protein [unclassified Streptomyces]|uniref:DUF6233 domain-containing protein n=1 Tax=unclassified Streptomyces TaxID=2593676 RepID=UPI0022515D20|nr:MULTISPECIES: DUF6233 domain-containing protein [unclassified Streptomyces]MCX4404911.1 DUF6233 domain-containing protein [Streptomyces sp. NBC_01764]MCX5190541.1 DUF6233 domain-containing protein [Streptomyces sp. NBC_00268]